VSASGFASGPPTVALATLISGFQQALTRWAEARVQTDPLVAFYALFAALAWTYTIDEFLKDRDGHHPSHCELRGLRFARHRVHHNWADALRLDRSGAAFPIQFPMTFFEWRWRPVRDLPPGQRSKDEIPYRNHLADRPARLTLLAVSDYVATL